MGARLERKLEAVPLRDSILAIADASYFDWAVLPEGAQRTCGAAIEAVSAEMGTARGRTHAGCGGAAEPGTRARGARVNGGAHGAGSRIPERRADQWCVIACGLLMQAGESALTRTSLA